VHYPRPLPRVLSLEEVGRLLEAAPGPGLKYQAALSVAYGAGLRAGEVVMLRVSDIDSSRNLIRVEQGKGARDSSVAGPFQTRDDVTIHARRHQSPAHRHQPSRPAT
jgi:integrase/recombinase XerD